MAINILRRPSDSPTVESRDDCRILRYATGGYNGVIKNFENECGYDVNVDKIKIKSGEVILDGWQCGIDSMGVELTIDSSQSKTYYAAYIELNLQLISEPKVEIKLASSTGDYPDVSVGDDLTKNPQGVKRLVLYHFESTNNTIANVQKKFDFCVVGVVKNADFATNAAYAENAAKAETMPQADSSNRVATTSYVRQAISDVKNITSADIILDGVKIGYVRRQVNFVVLKIEQIRVDGSVILPNIPKEFCPKTAQECTIIVAIPFGQSAIGETVYINIYTNGLIEISCNTQSSVVQLANLTVGYEITAIGEN